MNGTKIWSVLACPRLSSLAAVPREARSRVARPWNGMQRGEPASAPLSHTRPPHVTARSFEPIPILCPVQRGTVRAAWYRESGKVRRTGRGGASVESQTRTCRVLAVGHSARPALCLAFFHLCLNIHLVQPVWAEQAGASKHRNCQLFF